jgi:uncharacterized protein YjbI with pentapeptide repeats
MSQYSQNIEGAIQINEAIKNNEPKEGIITLSKRLSQEAIEQTGRGLHFGLTDEGEINISRKDYRGIELPSVEFYQTVMNATDFTGANLKNARFLAAACHKTIFDKAVLDGANMHAQSLLTCNLKDTNMQDVIWTGGNSHGCNFEGVDLSFSDISGTGFYETTLKDIKAIRVFGNGANIQLSRIDGSDFTRAILPNSNFYMCNVKDTSFKLANLRKSTVNEGSWLSVNFEESSFYGAVLTSLIRGGLILQNPIFNNVDFITANLKVDIQDGSVGGATFDYARLFGSNVNNTMSMGTDFSRATAIKSDFRDSNLSSDDFGFSDRNVFE